MTADEAVATGGFVEIPFCDVGALEWTGRPAGEHAVIANLNEDGVVWAVNLYYPPAAVENGLDFGMPFDEVERLFGSRLMRDVDHFGDGSDGLYAVNGRDSYIQFVIKDDLVDAPSLAITLQAGTVTPDTMPDWWSCKASGRN
jgi:hypothetical protein